MQKKLFILILLFFVFKNMVTFALEETAPDVFYWEFNNDNWYYKDMFGNTQTGRFYDAFGDIYDTAGSKDGKILMNGKNQYGEIYGPDGRLINPSMMNASKYKEMAIRYEAGEPVSFLDTNDFLYFIEYYTVQYRLHTYIEPYQESRKALCFSDRDIRL